MSRSGLNGEMGENAHLDLFDTSPQVILILESPGTRNR